MTLDELAEALKRTAEELPERVEKALDAACDRVVADASARSPVRTGLLRRSWRYVRSGRLRRTLSNNAKVPGRNYGDTKGGYSSLVFAKGDRTRTPIYPELVRQAAAVVEEEVRLVLDDLTEPYKPRG